jgi:hypothetical protein
MKCGGGSASGGRDRGPGGVRGGGGGPCDLTG